MMNVVYYIKSGKINVRCDLVGGKAGQRFEVNVQGTGKNPPRCIRPVVDYIHILDSCVDGVDIPSSKSDNSPTIHIYNIFCTDLILGNLHIILPGYTHTETHILTSKIFISVINW